MYIGVSVFLYASIHIFTDLEAGDLLEGPSGLPDWFVWGYKGLEKNTAIINTITD